jgi:methionyl-tRNA formyltransferase
LVSDNLDHIVSFKFGSYPQKSVGSTYFSKDSIDFTKLEVPTNASAWQAACFTQAFSFREFQLPTFKGLPIYQAEVTEDKAINNPGYVVEESPYHFLVETIDFRLKLKKDLFDQLMEAARNGDIAAIQSIEMAGFDIAIRTTREGWNVLIVAAYHNKLELVKWLIERRGWGVNQRNYKGTTLLMYSLSAAIRDGDTAVFDYLVSFPEIDLDARDDFNLRIVDYVKKHGSNCPTSIMCFFAIN